MQIHGDECSDVNSEWFKGKRLGIRGFLACLTGDKWIMSGKLKRLSDPTIVFTEERKHKCRQLKVIRQDLIELNPSDTEN